MENPEKELTKKMSSIRDWLKNKENLLLLAVLLFAFITLLYFFVLNKNQALWWDEAVYGVLAKNFITDIWRDHSLVLSELKIRPPLLPLMWAGLMILNISEAGSRFILGIIPSIFSVFFVYLISKEVFNKKIAIISTLIFSIIWNYLFFSIRFLPDVPATFFLLASIYFFIISIKNDFIPKHFFVSIFLMSLSTLTRYNNGIFFLVYLFILMPTKKFYYKDKNFWFSGLFGLIPLFIFFFVNFIMYGNIFQALLGGEYITIYQQRPFAWDILNYTQIYLGTIFLTFFILGSVLILFKLVVSYDMIFKKLEFQRYILLILIFLFIHSLFIFFMKGAEDRYLFPMAITLSCFSGFGLFQTYNFVRKYNKLIAIILLISILFFGVYTQIKQADQIIKIKSESFLQIKQGVKWLESNVPKESVIIGAGLDPYSIYYSNLNITYYWENETEKNEKADYAVIHAFPPQDTYLTVYIQNNTDKWVPIKAFFFDKQNTQPALIIYKINNN